MRSRGDTGEFELPKKVVVLGMGAPTLVNLDGETELVVSVGGEDVELLGGEGGVSFDERSHDATSGLNAGGKRSNVEQKQLLILLRVATRENGGPVRDGGPSRR